MSNVAEAIAEAVRKRGEDAEENALIEVRVGFAKDKLIPKFVRWAKETADVLHPLQTKVHRAISLDLFEMTGKGFHGEVNLGGITVHPVVGNRAISFSIFGSYDPLNGILSYIILLSPLIPLKDSIYKTIENTMAKPAPKLKVDVESKCYDYSFQISTSKCGEVRATKVEWPHINSERYAQYLQEMWMYVSDLVFALAGPNSYEGEKNG
jgi:hypothetical protein